MFATAWPPHAQPFGKIEGGTVRCTNQLSLVDQELAGHVVQPAPLVRTAVQPGLQWRSVAIDDDRRHFAVDIGIYGHEAAWEM